MGIFFDGVDDNVTIPAAASINNIASGNMFVSVWLYHQNLGTGTSVRIFSKGRGVAGWLFGWRTASHATNPNSFLFAVKRATADALTNAADNTLSDNTEFHLMATWDGGTNPPNLYVNNVLVTSFESVPTAGSGALIDDSTHDLLIGNQPVGFLSPFAGYIREVCWGSFMPSAADRAKLYNGGHPVRGEPYNLSSPILGYYTMLDSTIFGNSANAATVADKSGNGNNGTGSNGANGTGCTWVNDNTIFLPNYF
ncbi:MAG: LamG domain-containing protein [Actinobacteria bacterium]|nr:LamG domain-containing protein [Actinomycetota bacterium]